MGYDFKKLSEVNNVEVVSDNATVLAVESGQVVQVPKDQVGKEVPEWVGTVKTVNGAQPDEEGNVEVSSLPEGAPYKSLVTDGSGNWVAEDRLAYGTKTGGDTFEWDGNTEGLVAVEWPYDGKTFYKVSDEIPDLSTGKISYACKNVFHFEDGSVDYGNITGDDEWLPDYLVYVSEIAIVPEEAAGVPYQVDETTVVFPAKGIYLGKTIGEDYYSYTCQLTIKGFAGFPGIKTIDEKFLPTTTPKIQSATVGQTVVVKAVDADGKPTEWEAANLGTILDHQPTAAEIVEYAKRCEGVKYRTYEYLSSLYTDECTINEIVKYKMYDDECDADLSYVDCMNGAGEKLFTVTISFDDKMAIRAAWKA